MNQERNEIVKLHGTAQFALFVSSYLPLFVLIIVRQVTDNWEYFNYEGLTLTSLFVFIKKFGLSFTLILTSIIGLFGYFQTLGNIEDVARNGIPITVKVVKNKNSEAIGYIATYIIPFLFQSFNGLYEFLSVLFLLSIIYRIYINSSLLLINPLLSFRFSIYEIDYEENKISKSGLIISRNKYLQDYSEIKIYEIGHKLFFATDNK